MAPKLTQNSAAVKLLLSKLRSGEITSAHTPAQVWKSEAIFQRHKLPAFRAKYNKTKKDFFGSTNEFDSKEDVEEEELNRRCNITSPPLKKRIIEETIDSEGEELEDETHEELFLSSNVNMFKPLYLLSIWKEPKTQNRRISVAIVLPSGVSAGNFSVSITESGRCLQLTVCWPDGLLNLERLHKKWLTARFLAHRIEAYHPKISGFEDALKQHRKQASDIVESHARIPLPFPVETHIDGKHNLGWKDRPEMIVYLDLKSAMDSYAVTKDLDSFELL